MYKRIVVPLDGSDLAAAALPHARDAAKTHDAPIVLVRAVDPPLAARIGVLKDGTRTILADHSATFEEEDTVAREYIDREVQRLERDGFQASGLVIWGHAASAVASTVNDTDLVVMSSLGRTGLRRWFLGSVAEDILKRTSVPVLIIRQPSSAG